MQNGYLQVKEGAAAEFLVHLHRSLELALFVLLDDGINDVGLMSSANLLAYKIPHFRRAFVGDPPGYDRSAAGRHFINYRQIKISVESERQGARNRGSGHDQHV